MNNVKTPDHGRTGVRVMFYIAPELDEFIETVRAGKSRSKWLRDLIAEKYKRPEFSQMLEPGRREPSAEHERTKKNGKKNGHGRNSKDSK